MKNNTSDDNTSRALDKANKYEKEVLKKVFPNAHFSQSIVFGGANDEINSFKGTISTGNIFKGTSYEFGEKKELIHFTSLNSLIQILRNGYFRMSDFNCLDDDEELNYSLKKFHNLNLEKENIKQIKQNLFCFSSCESNDRTIFNHFMWEVYSDKGRGCAIEYKLTKNNPYKFLHGVVKYGENQFDEINTTLELSEKFSQLNNGFYVQDLPRVLLNILIFHKSKSYEIEDEVRLVYNQKGVSVKNNINPHIYSDLYKNQKVRRFLKLYLKGKHPFLPNKELKEDQVLDIFPQVEIKRIILGTHINSDDLIDLINLLREVQSENNYTFEIWKMNLEKQIYKIG